MLLISSAKSGQICFLCDFLFFLCSFFDKSIMQFNPFETLKSNRLKVFLNNKSRAYK